MATSSITKNFVVSGKKQAKMFVDAIENSYQESLHRTSEPDLKITRLKNANDIKNFMAKRNKSNA